MEPTNEILAPVSLCHRAQAGKGLKHSEDLRINCSTCDKPYCSDCASTIDPSHCVDCLNDFQVTEDVFTRTDTDYNPKTNEFVTRTQKCAQLHLKGTSWLFYQRAIATLDEEQLKMQIQWHRAAVQMCENTLTQKKMDKFAHLKGVSIVKRTITKKETKPRERRKKELVVDAAMLAKLATALGKIKMTPEQLKMLGIQVALQPLDPSAAQKLADSEIIENEG